MSVSNADFNSPAYKRSRRAYTIECAFEYFIALLVSDAFLAKLLKSIGMSDALTGIISSFVSLSFLFQLFSVLIAHKIRNTKRFVSFFHFLGQMFFMTLYLVPFMPFVKEYRQLIAICCILFAYFGNYFVTSVIYKWGNSHVEPHRRAVFSSVKETISLITGMIVTLAVGHIMDNLEAVGRMESGFIFASVAIFIFAVCDFVCLMLIKNDVRPKEEKIDALPLRDVIKNTVGNKDFRHVILLKALWSVALYTTFGFLGTYRIGELAFTVGAVQIINIAGVLSRAAVSVPIGKYSDKHSFASGIQLGLSVAVASFACCMLTTPSWRYLIIAYTVLYNVSQAGISGNMINMTYSYVDYKYFVQATAINNSIGGVCGFLAALGAGKLLSVIQANGNMLFGVHVYGQQVLAGISLALTVVCMIYNHFVVGKQRVMKQ